MPALGTAAGVVLRVGYSLGTSGTNKPYGSFPENAGHVRLAARDRDRQRLAVGGPKLDDIGAGPSG